MSFWEEAAGTPQVEGGGFSDLPANVWFGGTTTTDENGGARPKIAEVAFDERTTHKLSFGVIVDAGEKGKAEANCNGRFCFAEAWVDPNPKGDDKNNLVSGRLTGLLNSLYASGVAVDVEDTEERANQRWQETIRQLAQIADREGLTLEQYEGDKGLYLAAVALADLQQNSKRILFKTSGKKDKNDPKIIRIKVGAFEDAIEANETKRGVVSFDDAGNNPEF